MCWDEVLVAIFILSHACSIKELGVRPVYAPRRDAGGGSRGHRGKGWPQGACLFEWNLGTNFCPRDDKIYFERDLSAIGISAPWYECSYCVAVELIFLK